MRDPTRGGLAATLNEIAHQSGVGIRIEEDALPVKKEVAAACELLGLDPLYVANEGKLVAFVAAEAAETLLAVMRGHPLGRESAIIGHVVRDDASLRADGDEFRRRAHRRLAVRRTIAAHLLREKGMNPSGAVLIVDDELRSLESLQRVLSEEFDVLCAQNAQEAEAILAGDLVQVILCDQRMPGETGVDFLRRVREAWPDPVRMIISGFSESEDIIAGVNEAGIYQYITKPWHPQKLIDCVRDAVKLYRMQKEPGGLGADAKPSHDTLNRVLADRRREQRRMFEFDRIVHEPDGPMVETLALARKATQYDISVVITGASGAGKELLARAIHFGSARGDKPFVVENCGALPDELLESELFGCKKGAYTGAYQDRIGLFELADGGTIFLDEVGETSPAFQVKLLRVLQEREIRPLGATRSRKVDVRVISATNRDLEIEVEEGRFRRDLFYRLNAFPIHLPALAERSGDIPKIAANLLAEVNRSFRRKVPGFAPETMARLVRA